ncbi:MAG TPA: hypothetical protein ENI87_09415, partial [bacterium]|nr:hypothetical protein [bacterium]
VDKASLHGKLKTLKLYGVPYTDEQIANAIADYDEQAAQTVAKLAASGKTFVVDPYDPNGKRIDADPDTEIIALIAYLKRLGQNLEPDPAMTASSDGGN